jgi:hypothetical protein
MWSRTVFQSRAKEESTFLRNKSPQYLCLQVAMHFYEEPLPSLESPDILSPKSSPSGSVLPLNASWASDRRSVSWLDNIELAKVGANLREQTWLERKQTMYYVEDSLLQECFCKETKSNFICADFYLFIMHQWIIGCDLYYRVYILTNKLLGKK